MHQSTNTDGSLFVYEWSRHPLCRYNHFRSLIGDLQYLAITHPDIQFAINRVAQRMHQLSEHDYHCLKHILRYIFGTLSRGLLIRTGDLELRGFSDSNWANDKNDKKSTSGFLVFMGPNLISWCTKKQPKVSRSSTEAKYRALALLAAETMWVTYILRELRATHTVPALYCDNKSTNLCGQEFRPTHQNEAC